MPCRHVGYLGRQIGPVAMKGISVCLPRAGEREPVSKKLRTSERAESKDTDDPDLPPNISEMGREDATVGGRDMPLL
jgi:hypothetical protein